MVTMFRMIGAALVLLVSAALVAETYIIRAPVSGGTPSGPPVTLTGSIADQYALQTAPFSFEIDETLFAGPQPLVLAARQANGDPLPGWLGFAPETRRFSIAAGAGVLGAYPLSVTATSAAGTRASASFTLTVTDNPPPALALALPDAVIAEADGWGWTIPAGSFTDDGALALSARQANGDPLPGWLGFDAGTDSFGVSAGTAVAGLWDITVTATDGFDQRVSDSFRLSVLSAAPVLVSPLQDVTIRHDQAWDFTIPADRFSDDGPLTVTASVSGGAPLPGWMGFDGAARRFTGAAGTAVIGSHAITVTAMDGEEQSISDEFIFAVTNAAPVLASPLADRLMAWGAALDVTLPADSFSDDVAIVSWAASRADGSALPAGLSFEAASRRFTADAGSIAAGDYTIRVTVTDGPGETAFGDFTLTVEGLPDFTGVGNGVQLDESGLIGSVRYGAGVAIDGNRIVVGGNQTGNSAKLYEYSGGSWGTGTLLPGGGADYFHGMSVAIDGDLAVVGDPYSAGDFRVFERSGGNWPLTRQVVPTGGADDRAGSSLAVHGDLVFAAAPFDDNAGTNAGSVAICPRSGWASNDCTILTGDETGASDYFGFSLAVSRDGSTLVVGAPMGLNEPPSYQCPAHCTGNGAVHVFEGAGTSWTQVARLLPDNSGQIGFGASVAVSDDGGTIIVGAPQHASRTGAVYAFTRGGGWSDRTASAPTLTGAAANQWFGSSVALGRGTLAVGAWWDSSFGANQGAVYLFSGSGTSWGGRTAIHSGAGVIGFGWRLAMEDDMLVVGENHVRDGHVHAGNAYVFEGQ